MKLTVKSTLQNEILLVLHISYYNSNFDKDSQTVTKINCEIEASFKLAIWRFDLVKFFYPHFALLESVCL